MTYINGMSFLHKKFSGNCSGQRLFLDIELCDLIPDDFDRFKFPLLDISCIALLHDDAGNKSLPEPDGMATSDAEILHNETNPNDPLEAETIRVLTDRISMFLNSGGQVVTWNGVGFDLPALAAYNAEARDIILHDNHVDIMFHFLRKYGFPVSLDKVAKGFGLPGKDQDGKDAVELWKQGKLAQLHSYNLKDVKILRRVYRRVMKHKVVAWVTKSGNFTDKPVDLDNISSWKSCRLPQLTEDQVSWMPSDFKRKFEWAWSDQLQ